MNYFDNGHAAVLGRSAALPQIDARPLLRLVYTWMSLGLLLTAGVAWFVASQPQLVMDLYPMWIPLAIGQFILVMVLSWGINRMSPAVATTMFFVYAGTMGLTMGMILFGVMAQNARSIEDIGSLQSIMPIAKAFLTTSGLFGAMTIIGFTTKIDLSRFSTFFMMATIGLVIAMVVNIFLQSDAFSFAISVFGVLLFTGLTAYDTQKIKEMANTMDLEGATLTKVSIIGALTLYLDFINLFLFLLRLFSGNRD
jgi:FtsH-binding integral membrane protein